MADVLPDDWLIDDVTRSVMDTIDMGATRQSQRDLLNLERLLDAGDRIAARQITQTAANAESIAKALSSDPTL